MLASECDEKYIVMPDGSLEKDETGLIPPDVPVIPLSVAACAPRSAAWVEIVYQMGPVTLGQVNELQGHTEDPDSPLGRYKAMRLDGQSHNMAIMLATRSFPGVKSDAIFNEKRCNGNQFEATPAQGDWLRKQAEARGVSTTGKTYLSGLASFPGDPTAWVADRHDVVAVAKAKGLSVDGYVTHHESPRGPAPSGNAFEVAPSLIRSEAEAICRANPGANFEAVADRLTQVRSGKVDLGNPTPGGE